MRMGFVVLAGRPNVGKSTLLNALCGKKLSIVSDKPQTTRHRIRGILNRPDAQIVFVDSPGIHKPKTALGERVNEQAYEAIADTDVNCLLVPADEPFGTGDQWVADRLDMSRTIVVVNKIDKVPRDRVLTQLARVSELGALAYFPVSARTGEGVEALIDELEKMLPEGQAMYPPEMSTETSMDAWVAELVREVLLDLTHDELPYSIATRVVSVEDGVFRCEIVVERESQKGMVIGKGGAMLKEVRRRVRKQMPKGSKLELVVTTDKDWQHRPDRVQRLGY
ncbi:MAG: GTP-binding protein Era [Actinomycetota bacterium]